MHIDPRHLKIIQKILDKNPYTFYIFGSRLTGKHLKKFSDLDLCYFEKISSHEILRLEEDFEESNIPYRVDLIDWNACSSEFQKIIFNDLTLFKEGKSKITITLKE